MTEWEPNAHATAQVPAGAEEEPGVRCLRIHVPHIRLDQWRSVARVARTYSPRHPLHLTTRQNIELHGVGPEHVAAAQKDLARAGLRAVVRSCGDTLRRVTTCPGHGRCPGSADLWDVAAKIRASAETLPFINSMPRKFKISVSGCENACAMPWIQDLGLVAAPDGTFRAIVAGSLGARPGIGIPLYEGLKPEDLVPLAVAALRFFNAEGDRTNRARARFRCVRERLGDRAFAERLGRAFQSEKEEAHWPVPEVKRAGLDERPVTRLHLPLGDIAADAALRLADAVEATRSELRIGLDHDLFLFGEVRPRLDPDLRALANGPGIVACSGRTWCRRGIADSRAAATQIRAALSDGRDLTICVGGCPNSCGHAAVADIGLTGCVTTLRGRRTECFRLLAGGDRGRGPALARELHPAVPADRAAEVVAWLVAQHQARRRDGESFAEFARRQSDALSNGINGVLER